MPEVGDGGMKAQAAISASFQQHAATVTDKGNRLQSPEKTWVSVARDLKAVSQGGRRNVQLSDLAAFRSQPGRETNSAIRFFRHSSTANTVHGSFQVKDAQ